jgi:hypothetical protein
MDASKPLDLKPRGVIDVGKAFIDTSFAAAEKEA